MKATWIAPFVLALATTPALAGEQSGATGQSTNGTSTASQQSGGMTGTDTTRGQDSQSGSMTDNMKQKAGEKAGHEIDKHTSNSSGMQQKAGEKAKQGIDSRTGSNTSGNSRMGTSDTGNSSMGMSDTGDSTTSQ
ncbi:hypothetical protein SAMN05421848_3022 [Kushneria avicenniae]|uniref:Late embryogenesis abundant protein n=1 Tax=Kushneria avicenniae TaxID=402385 RepID=A0A1I1MMC4_9GAMM|nr:hypothetical protein [Kushneria avicenniae]SFC85982.1 hypothetical protein SAMN05421848_3022 [Kushneria avicenniae]